MGNCCRRHDSNVEDEYLVNDSRGEASTSPPPNRVRSRSERPTTSTDNRHRVRRFSTGSNGNNPSNSGGNGGNIVPVQFTDVPSQIGPRSLSASVPEGRSVSQMRVLAMLERIPTRLYSTNMNGPTECNICYHDFDEKSQLRVLPCTHYYHVTCIDAWLLKEFQCPNCRVPVEASLILDTLDAGLDSGYNVAADDKNLTDDKPDS